MNFSDMDTATRPARSNIINLIGGTTVRKEPLGPMVAAIAAGCAIILKPSDVPKASEALITQMVAKYLDLSAIRCVTAGPAEIQHILDQHIDHSFYTGSASVAKIIHAAAAKHLTPVTLELGGQEPAIVCKSANIDVAAKRIAATKFMNAGQICLNVNHVLVDPTVRDALVARLAHHFDMFMGGSARNQPDYYTRIVNERHFDRLDNLLKQTSGRLRYGGERDRAARFMSPSIVAVKPGDCLLNDELFGPILPVIDADLDTALAITRSDEHPLAVYAFTSDAADKKRVLDGCLSGGVTFNDCTLHAAVADAPFGGVGHSGMGYYHGPYGILAFSHLRTYMEGPPAWMQALMSVRYPPYTLDKAKMLAPKVNPSFDRDGNQRRCGWSVRKWGVGLAAAGAVVLPWSLRACR
ncbi:Aldehyde/histidinol dehydrogenase [Aspergillus navahoensis]